jgi:NTE family protein
MPRHRWFFAIVLVGFLGGVALGAGSDDTPNGDRPTIGLVLAGGGARGAAHIGVIEVLEELQVPVDYIVGTSMGSIIGGLYASGMSPEQMKIEIAAVDWIDVFNDAPPRKDLSFRRKQDDNAALFEFEVGVGRGGFKMPAGFIAGSKLNFLLRKLTLPAATIQDFDDLPIPFRAVAGDLSTGEAVVIGRGDLAVAMRASMAIPGVFTPVEWEDHLLVDGGIVRNLPVDIMQEIGPDIIIAVDVGTQPKELAEGEEKTAFGVAKQTVSLMSKRPNQEQRDLLTERDFLMIPDLSMVTTADFLKLDQAVAQGVAVTEPFRERLAEHSVPDTEWERYIARHRTSIQEAAAGIAIDEVEVLGLQRLNPRIVERRIRTQPGGTLDLAALRDDLERINEIGEFEQVGFRIVPEGDGNRLQIGAREKSWGPNFLRMGLRLESNLEGKGDFSVLLNLRKATINGRGGELQSIIEIGDRDAISAELFQPLRYSGFLFVAPRIFYERDEDEFFLPNDELAVLDIEQVGAQFDVGVQFRNWGEIRLGVRAGQVDVEELSGTLLRRGNVDVVGWVAQGALDRLDNKFFPRYGSSALIRAEFPREDLDSDDQFDKIELRVSQAWSVKNNTVLGTVRLGTDDDSDLPSYADFRLGGFFNLSGFQRDRLAGDVLTYGALAYYRRIRELPALFGGGVYVGAGLEAGNVWEDDDDVEFSDMLTSGVVFVGAETILGPLYVGYGRAEGSNEAWYLVLGNVFR